MKISQIFFEKILPILKLRSIASRKHLKYPSPRRSDIIIWVFFIDISEIQSTWDIILLPEASIIAFFYPSRLKDKLESFCLSESIIGTKKIISRDETSRKCRLYIRTSPVVFIYIREISFATHVWKTCYFRNNLHHLTTCHSVTQAICAWIQIMTFYNTPRSEKLSWFAWLWNLRNSDRSSCISISIITTTVRETPRFTTWSQSKLLSKKRIQTKNWPIFTQPVWRTCISRDEISTHLIALSHNDISLTYCKNSQAQSLGSNKGNDDTYKNSHSGEYRLEI